MDYTEYNKQTMRIIATSFCDKVIKPRIISLLSGVAQRIVDIINGVPSSGGTNEYPVYTGNMLDATGVAVYSDGVTKAYLPTQKATRPQATDTGYIYGLACLQQAITSGATRFSNGIWMVLFSATPYAYTINLEGSPKNRGQGFFDNLVDITVTDVINGMRPISVK